MGVIFLSSKYDWVVNFPFHFIHGISMSEWGSRSRKGKKRGKLVCLILHPLFFCLWVLKAYCSPLTEPLAMLAHPPFGSPFANLAPSPSSIITMVASPHFPVYLESFPLIWCSIKILAPHVPQFGFYRLKELEWRELKLKRHLSIQGRSSVQWLPC